MSQENVETFKRGVTAYNRRDVEALLGTLDPEVEWHPALEVVLGGDATCRGHEGIREMLRTVEEALDSFQVELRVRTYLDPEEAFEAAGLRE